MSSPHFLLCRSAAGSLLLLSVPLIAQDPAISADSPAALTRAALPGCAHLPPPVAERAVPNDNRVPAGRLKDGVLTLTLVAQHAAWYPDGPDGCGVEVYTFAEEGQPAQIPGPLIRVPAGTEVRVTLRSTLPDTFWVRGLQDRTGQEIKHVEVAPSAVREIRFRALEPGTYFYWTTFAAESPDWPSSTEYGTMLGALVVDPPGVPAEDRIFVTTRWTGPRGTPSRGFELNAVNGRSWPNTERLTLTQGEPVRWRVINAANDLHAMHLHGFYFLVTGRGGPSRDRIYDPEEQELSVTEMMGPGRSLSLEWTPTEPGNWIFHCHLVRHMSVEQRLDRMPGAAHAHTQVAHANHATDGMAGLVMGLTVRPAPDFTPAPEAVSPRRIRIFANARERVFGERPGYAFVVQEGEQVPAPDSIRIPGTPLLLERGQPVAITVVNRLPRPISVHWHGIELESYADGVADWSGTPGRIAPAIAPADSFTARFVPPRAGTFIYHVHMEVEDELASGLYGPLLVLEPGEKYDPETDRVFVLSQPGPGSGLGREKPPFVNGTASPEPLDLVSGRTYRLRLIGISADDLYIVRLLRGDKLLEWRPVARHGADLNPALSVPVAAREAVVPGSTFDFEFTPDTAGDLTLEVDVVQGRNGAPARTPTVVPIRVLRMPYTRTIR